MFSRRRRAGDRDGVVVGGEDHDGGGEAGDGDHRDGEQRSHVVVVGAEYDCGVLISFFDTSAHADESTRLASNWVREQKLETALPNPPKITSGEVVVHKTSELVQA